MKKLIFIASALAVISVLLFAAFKPTPGYNFASKDNPETTTAKNTKNKPAFDQPVDYTLAMGCIAMYQHVYFNAANVDSIAKAYTTSVSFGSKNLSNWALDIATNTNAVKTKMCFGIYTQAMADANPIVKVGRLTIFLFPVDINGNRAVYIRNSTYSSPTYDGKFMPAANSGSATPPYNVGGSEP